MKNENSDAAYESECMLHLQGWWSIWHCNSTDFLYLEIKVAKQAQLVKAVPTKPDDLCFIPEIHMVHGET